jgi:hypothetical protein
LTKQGTPTTAGHVQTIKSKIRRRRRRRVVKEVAQKTGISLTDVKAAISLLKVCGSAAAAKEALAAAVQIKAML